MNVELLPHLGLIVLFEIFYSKGEETLHEKAGRKRSIRRTCKDHSHY